MDKRTFIIAVTAILFGLAALWTGFALGWWQALAVWLIGDGLILAVALLTTREKR